MSLTVKEAIQACLDGMIIKATVNDSYGDQDFKVWYDDSGRFYAIDLNETPDESDGVSVNDFIFVGYMYEYKIYEPPKQKKRYWIWDVGTNDGNILKDPNYMDENGELCNGDVWRGRSGVLIKKHENEWIEV